MALSEDTKVDIRRHLRYGAIGQYKTSAAGGTLAVGSLGWRFFRTAGNLEYRMNNLSPVEEAKITGFAVGSVSFIGANPAPGDQFTAALSGGGLSQAQQVTVTAVAGDTPLSLSSKMAAALAANTTIAAAGFVVTALYGAGPFGVNQQVPLPEVSVTNTQPFIFAVSTTSSLCAPQVVGQGAQRSPSADLTGQGNVTFGFIPLLNGLEAALFGASQNLDTRRADVWYARSNEIAQRRALYEQLAETFAEFIAPINPDVSRHKFQHLGPVRYV